MQKIMRTATYFLFTHLIFVTLSLFSGALSANINFEEFSELGIGVPSANTVTLIRGDVSYGSQTPITINRAGVYRLTDSMSATGANTALTINASNVELDLDGNIISGGATGISVTGNAVTIKNGAVKNASNVGIKISGSKCQLENLDVISSRTGFLLQSTSANTLTNCRALSSTNAGFSLVSSSTNSFSACQALNTNGGTQAAYGFISQSGYGNNFAQCVAQDTRTALTNAQYGAAGFLFGGSEQQSSITNSQALGTVSLTSTTTAYGIAMAENMQLAYQQGTNAINSLSWSPNSQYLAMGDTPTNSDVSVYAWNGTSLVFKDSKSPGSFITSVAWHPSGAYLAVTKTVSGTVSIYAWNGSTLSFITSQNHGAFIRSIAWSPDGTALAAGGDLIGGVYMSVYLWDGANLSLTDLVNTGDLLYSVAFSSDGKYLATGGNTGANNINMYAWNGTKCSLPPVSLNSGSNARSVSWLPTGNSLLAIGTASGLSFVYLWTGNTLTPVASQNHGAQVNSVSWSPDGNFLALAGLTGTGGYQIREYFWNGSSLINILNQAHRATVNSVAWSSNGNYLAAGGANATSPDNAAEIYRFTPANCIIKNNQVTGTSTPSNLGIGIKFSSINNYVAQNLCCNNNTNYQYVSSSYLASQANTRGVDNVDCNLTTPDSVVTINNNVNLLAPEQWSIESKCEVISSKIDLLALPCTPTNIVSGGTTLSNKPNILQEVTISGVNTPGYYCLAANITDDQLSISSSNVVLDLNGFTLTIPTDTGHPEGVLISGNEVTVKNGTIVISGTLNTGVRVTGSRCTLENLDVLNSSTGFLFQSVTDCTIKNCRALNCTQNGFYLNRCQRNTLNKCTVLNLGGATASSAVVTGFLSAYGKANVFDSCSVSNAFTKVNSASAQATGFRIAAEGYSTITNCTVNGVSTTAALPNLYGIQCPMVFDQNITITGLSPGTQQGQAVSWLEYQGQRYLAAGFQFTTGAEIAIFRYTGSSTLQVVAYRDWPAQILSLDWVTSGNNNYLALGSVGYGTSPTNFTVQTYRFTPPRTLTPLGGRSRDATTLGGVWAVSWLSTCTSDSTQLYLAASGNPGSVESASSSVYSFNGSTLTPLAKYSTGNTIYANAWITIGSDSYLAIGQQVPGTVNILKLTPPTLTSVASLTAFPGNSFINTVAWLATSNGKYYVAACAGSTTTSYQVAVAQFNPLIPSLTQVATYNAQASGSNGVLGLSWLPGIDDLNYLAIGSETPTDTNNVRILRFDGSCLTPIFNYNAEGTSRSVDWLTTGSTILAVATSTTANPVRAFGFSPTRNLITNNTVSGVRGGTSATGYAVEANNLLLNNVASNNGTNYYYTPEAGDSNKGYWVSPTGQ